MTNVPERNPRAECTATTKGVRPCIYHASGGTDAWCSARVAPPTRENFDRHIENLNASAIATEHLSDSAGFVAVDTKAFDAAVKGAREAFAKVRRGETERTTLAREGTRSFEVDAPALSSPTISERLDAPRSSVPDENRFERSDDLTNLYRDDRTFLSRAAAFVRYLADLPCTCAAKKCVPCRARGVL